MANSLYPNAIDGYAQLRVVRDGIDEILASDPNSLRSAVIAIEQTLGINPAGAYSSVADRIGSISDAYTLLEAHILATNNAHPASAISILDVNNFYLSTNVEGALDELGTIIPTKPNTIGQQQLGTVNTGYPTFVNKIGTKFVFNTGAPNPQTATQPYNITGIRIIDVSDQTPNGSATLQYTTTSPPAVQWKAPGDGSFGTAVDLSGMATGDVITVYSSTATKAIRVSRTSVSFPLLSGLTDNFDVYSLNAAAGTYSDTGTGFVNSNYITKTSITVSSISRGQFMISGELFPADQGTLVLQRKLRNALSFTPVAILDLKANFSEARRLTNQAVYNPSLVNYDTITLFDRFPLLADYSAIKNASGNQIYENFDKTFTNFQIAKYIIPASNNSIIGGTLQSPTDISQVEVDGKVSSYRLIHYHTGITNFNGDPVTDDIYSVIDAYGGGVNDGDDTVRMSNVYLDIDTNLPTVSSLDLQPVSFTESISKVLSGIHYYNSSLDKFSVDVRILHPFSNTYKRQGTLNFTTDVFSFPSGVAAGNYGLIVDTDELFNDGYILFSSSNLPSLTTDAFYLIDSTHNITRRISPNINKFSAKSRVSAYAIDPFNIGPVFDAYGVDHTILTNSYGIISTGDTEYFLDESKRVGTSENFNSFLTSGQFTSGLAAWNSSSPLSPGDLQIGGIINSSNPYIGGLIFPQENYTLSTIRPNQTSVGGSNYSNGSYQVDSIYQRVFSINSIFSEGVLLIKSSGSRPIVFNDLYYLNASRLMKIELKFPGITGFLDIGRLFSTGLTQDGYGCLDNEPIIDTNNGYLSLPFTFGEFNNSLTGSMLAVRITYFGAQFTNAKNIILSEIQLQPRSGVY